jgi:hypothetical protein
VCAKVEIGPVFATSDGPWDASLNPFDLADDQRKLIEPLLPRAKPGVGLLGGNGMARPTGYDLIH